MNHRYPAFSIPHPLRCIYNFSTLTYVLASKKEEDCKNQDGIWTGSDSFYDWESDVRGKRKLEKSSLTRNRSRIKKEETEETETSQFVFLIIIYFVGIRGSVWWGLFLFSTSRICHHVGFDDHFERDPDYLGDMEHNNSQIADYLCCGPKPIKTRLDR
ncbi:hypothetical protein QYF36_014646 [Acer negundo]|nr:hypothetical protein QYF36_014646 [Acer negundo]